MNPMSLLVSVVLLILLTPAQHAEALSQVDEISEEYAKQFLKTFGYWNSTKLEPTDSEEQEIIKEALRLYQRIYHLTETGELDEATKEEMKKPRCDMPDIKPAHGPAALRTPYTKQRFTYSILRYSDRMSKLDVDRCFQEAYRVWERCTDLRFEKKSDGSKVDFKIGFARYEHGDGSPFDGPSRVLAHAFFPFRGDLHMDDDETFVNLSIDTSRIWSAVDCVAVAAHEIGHNMGLDHTTVSGALMYPSYSPPQNRRGEYELKLHYDDITNMVHLYPLSDGSKGPCLSKAEGGTGGETQPEEPARQPDTHCPSFVEAIANGPDENVYVFQGNYVFKISATNVKRYAAKKMFPGLQVPVNAAILDESTKQMVIFSGNMEYKFTQEGNKRKLVSGYPRRVSTLTKPTGAIHVEGYGPFILQDSSYLILIYPNQLYTNYRQHYPHLPPGQLKGSAKLSDGNTYIFTSSEAYNYYVRTTSYGGSAVGLKSLFNC